MLLNKDLIYYPEIPDHIEHRKIAVSALLLLMKALPTKIHRENTVEHPIWVDAVLAGHS